jgi:alpha-N-arabinofuranosidase
MRTATLLFLAAALAAGQDTVIRVDAGKKAHYRIPRTIYGTFLEPIGRAIYGGLWAQTLDNPSLEENLWSTDNTQRIVERDPALAQASRMGLPLPWEPLDATQGWRYEPRWGDAANSSRSLLLMALPDKQTGVRQQVYLPVHRVLRYPGSVSVKPVSGPQRIEVSLRKRNQPAAVLARSAIDLAGSGWQKYEFALELERGALARLEPADFVIAASNETRVLIDQALLFPADHVEGMEPEMIDLIRSLKSPVMRYGGNFTSGYHWKDGVGPLDRRVSMINQAWGIPEYNHFGTDEFLRYCKLTGAEPQICLNLGSGTPAEAAEWVRYVNERWGRTGLLWELGNELYGTWQIGYPTLARAADRAREFAGAVRAADPQARLIVTGADPDQFRDWNEQVLKIPGFEFISTHFVVGNGNVRRRNATPEFVAQSAFALPVGLERRLREMKQQIDRHGSQAKIAFTEYLFHGPNDRVPRFTNMGGAICTAGLLNTYMRVADFLTLADMTGTIEFGGIWKKRSQVYGVPAYWAFRMYSSADATQPVAVETTAGTYDVSEGNNRMPEIPGVPYLDVVAALNDAGDKLTLFCVNRDLHRDYATRIETAGFAASQARVQTLAGTSVYQANDEMRPEAVRPSESAARVRGVFEHVFPRASVTVVELSP